jgi:hypothetical protein
MGNAWFKVFYEGLSISYGFTYDKPMGRNEDIWVSNYDRIYPHYGVFHQICNYLFDCLGYTEHEQPFAEKMTNKLLWSNRRWGESKYFKFEAQRYPAGFKIEFWAKGPSRDWHKYDTTYYDSFKWNSCEYMEKLSFKIIAKKLAAYSIQLGVDNLTISRICGREWVMREINPDKNLDRHWGRWEDYKEHLGDKAKDRDGKTIANGQMKYFRDKSLGCLMRGQVYHNINNMWWVVLNETKHTNIASFELFDPTPDDYKKRRYKRCRRTEEQEICRRIGSKLYHQLINKGITLSIIKKEIVDLLEVRP